MNLLKINISPNARVGQPRAPVPAEHAVGLADMNEAFDRVGRTVHGSLIRLARGTIRRMECDLDFIFAGRNKIQHVRAPCSVHVVRFEHNFAVDADGRERIQTFAGQIQRITDEIFLRKFKCAAVNIILLHQIECFLLVIAPEWIFHFARVQKIGIDRSGHSRRNPVDHARLASPMRRSA